MLRVTILPAEDKINIPIVENIDIAINIDMNKTGTMDAIFELANFAEESNMLAKDIIKSNIINDEKKYLYYDIKTE